MADQDYRTFSIRIPVAVLDRVESTRKMMRPTPSKNWVINEAIAIGLPHVPNVAGKAPIQAALGRPRKAGALTAAGMGSAMREPGEGGIPIDRKSAGYTLVEADDGYTLESAVSEKIAWDLPEAA